MTDPTPNFDEQLSAFMDGELPPDQVRFLLKRLAHDGALRERWERWQVASACFKQNAQGPVDAGLADRVQHALTSSPTLRRSGMGWRTAALAASVALAVLLVPRLGSEQSAQPQFVQRSGPAAVVPAELPSVDVLLVAGSQHAPISPATSVDDLPLALSTQPKAWPKSPLLGGVPRSPGFQVGHVSEALPVERTERAEDERSR